MTSGLDEKTLTIKGKDSKEIYVYYWAVRGKPRAVVQILHGMAEHAGRYKRLADILNENDIAVYAEDHRGHGKTAGSVEKLGCIGNDGFNMIVEDNRILLDTIKLKHLGIPVIILGHSFGSFVTQEFITRYGNDLDGVILSGTCLMKGIEITAGSFAAGVLKTLSGEEKQSRLLDNLSFGAYNKRISNPSSKFDWLSRDVDEVHKYDQDPFCGTIFTTGFYYYFLKGLGRLYDKNKLDAIPKDLPVLIAAGNDDPLGQYGKNVEKLYEMYKEIGLKDVEIKLYPSARHEILNETNRDEVTTDFLEWIKSRI